MPTASHATPTVVVGYDGSPAADAALERGLDRVAAGGRLSVVHAWHPPRVLGGSGLCDVVAATSLARAQVMMDELPREHPRLRTVRPELLVLRGEPARAIADFADQVGADEIIAGTHGAGRTAALLGSVAHGLLHRAGCPVTIIPDRVLEAAPSRRAAASAP